MNKTALFIRHKAKPGQRDQVQGVWEKYIKSRVETNTAHETYYFCHDNNDPDAICVFQLFSSREDIDDFTAGEWYPQYLSEISNLIVEEPQITPADAIWIKDHI